MGSSQINIVNGALTELGEDRLQSMSEDKLAATVAGERYESTIKDLLGKAPWRFATVKAELSQDVAAPLNEWSVSYTLPGTMVRLLRVYPKAPYELFGRHLYANTTGLAADYVDRVSESDFIDPFVRLCELELAVRICMSLTNDKALKQQLQSDARFQFAAALAADAQQRPNVPIQSSPFTDVRG